MTMKFQIFFAVWAISKLLVLNVSSEDQKKLWYAIYNTSNNVIGGK